MKSIFVCIPYTAKLSRLYTKHTIHWKTFAVHQAHAIMYCTQQMIQGENFHDSLKTAKTAKVFPLESFPPRKFCRIRYYVKLHSCTTQKHQVLDRRWPGLLLQTPFCRCWWTTRMQFSVLRGINGTAWGTKLLLTAVLAHPTPWVVSVYVTY